MLMFWEKNELELMAQSEEQRRMSLRNRGSMEVSNPKWHFHEVEETCLCLKKPKELIQNMIGPTGPFPQKDTESIFISESLHHCVV